MVSNALPVEHHGRMTEIPCKDVFVYKADVVEHVILGYPFCKSCGLTIDPVCDCVMDISPSVYVFQMNHEVSELRGPLGEPQQDYAISGDSQAGITVAMCRHCSELYSWSEEVGRCCQKHLVTQGPTAPDRDEQGSQCCATGVLRPVLHSHASSPSHYSCDSCSCHCCLYLLFPLHRTPTSAGMTTFKSGSPGNGRSGNKDVMQDFSQVLYVCH